MHLLALRGLALLLLAAAFGCIVPAFAAPDASGAAASAPAPGNYRFRLPPGGTLVAPSRDLLEPAERAFLAGLPEVRVGLNLPDNRPYEVINADGEISGIQVEILTHLAQALGMKLKPVVLPSFPQALEALRQREVDVMATVGYEPSREAYMSFTLGTAPNPGAIIGRAADPRFGQLPTLNGQRVAIEKGYISQFYTRRLYPEVLIDEQPDTSHALRAVALGEDDYYVGSLLMSMDRIQRDSVAGLEVKKSLVYATGQMHFGVRSDWPLLASALSKGVAALRAGPLPQLEAALASLGPQAREVPIALRLQRAEVQQLSQRSVLRVGAVRGLTLLNEAQPGGGHTGIGADYAAQVAARLGVALDIVAYDSVAEMLDGLRAGAIHLVPFLTRTSARERDFVYSRAYFEMPYLLVARSDAPLYWDLDSLRGKRLALPKQHPLREMLDERYPDIRIVEAASGTDAMDRVARGDADAAIELKLFANMRINGDASGRLRALGAVEQLPAQFGFATTPSNAALMSLVNRALDDIPAAERERLLRRWVAIDFSPAFPWRRYLPLAATVATALLLLAGLSAWWMRRLAREVRVRSAAEQRLREVTDGVPGLVFQDWREADGRIVQRFASASREVFLGPGAGAVPTVLDAIARQMAPDEAAALRAGRDDSLAQERPFKQTLRYRDPRGGERWLHCEAIPRRQPDGTLSWTGYVVDVSGERALQAHLLHAMQAQNLFVASASHELRAPLQSITLALQRLADSPLEGAQRRLLGVARDSSASLVQLIDDVLDLARLEAQRLVLHPAPLDLQALLQQLVENHRLSAEARGLQLTLEWDPLIPGWLLLDSLRLRQLLVNLVSNAIKYTPQGSVHLSARRTRVPEDALLLCVRDTGIGIPPDRQSALFEPFETLHHPNQAPSEGSTGLGLAICKRLVDAMGGRITLTSAPGRGTEVCVALPMPESALEPSPGSSPLVVPPALPARPIGTARAAEGTVLLIDDDEVSRLLMADLLHAEGWRVFEAGSLAAARQHWRTAPAALVISDRHLPDGDGLLLLHEFGQQAQAAGRPLRRVLCSGSLPETDVRLADIDAVLRKPVSAETLKEQLLATVAS